jgi:oligopeptide/dipeptide ABC transporter ATP-binding protein
VPRPGSFPPGCRFFPRCPTARAECGTAMPELRQVQAERWVRCINAKQNVCENGLRV